ncbi:MAG: nuclear transport factor 2 family protein [Phycisphaerales bacterium]|nr:MAG: nuclear transport factor 2 family protein [Phycisphaerales bacterium]
MKNDDANAIQAVIEEAYVQGIHEMQDADLARRGFHESFQMHVLKDGHVMQVKLADWLDRVEELKTENPELWRETTTLAYDLVDVAGEAAVAKFKVYKGRTFFSTDYMLLYRFPEGWRIVAKVFTLEE